MPSNDVTLDFWFAWDGADSAIFGCNTTRPLEVTARPAHCDVFVARAMLADGTTSTIIDFFWLPSQRGILRPLMLPSQAVGVELSQLSGERLKPVIRYRLERDLERGGANCDLLMLQLQAKQRSPNTQPARLRRFSPTLAEADRVLEVQQRSIGADLLWAIAAPYQPTDETSVGTGIREVLVGPLVVKYPRSADRIKVTPLNYRAEPPIKIDARERERSPAILSVAYEPRHIVALKVDVPASEVSPHDTVPGLVVYHYMQQRELITLWAEAAETPLFRYTVAHLEALEGAAYPFPRSGLDFVVKALDAARDEKDAIIIKAREGRSGAGPLRSFEVTYLFATLGDLLIVHDLWGGTRLSTQEGEPRHSIVHRVGPESLEFCSDLDELGAAMIEAAQALDDGYAVPHNSGDEAARALLELVLPLAGFDAIQATDLGERPLLPLVAISYDAHVRHNPEARDRVQFEAFRRDPGVISAALLSKMISPQPSALSGQRFQSAAHDFSLRLAAQLGASDLIQAPQSVEADIRAIDHLTRNNESQREFWANASEVGVKLDLARSAAGDLGNRLKEFREWTENEAVVDEILHSAPVISERFAAYRHNKPPYRRPIAPADFDQLYALIQPTAFDVLNAREFVEGRPGIEPSLPTDRRSTEELKADVEGLIDQALASDDPALRGLAQQIRRSAPSLRKQLREAEKRLKDLIGSPAISGEILALIDRLETWASLSSDFRAVREPGDRRDRIIALADAQSHVAEPAPASTLGRDFNGIVTQVERECARLGGNPALEDGEVLSRLPAYARLLCYHVAYQSMLNARNAGGPPSPGAARALALWPQRAPDCWDRHERWAKSLGPEVFDQLRQPWAARL